MPNKEQLKKQIRNWTLFVMFAIALSGITAFPIESELRWLNSHSEFFPASMSQWIHKVYAGVSETNFTYPFLAYGTDWLAFAHIVIAMLYIGILKDPVKNKWIIDWTIACCILVFPLALFAGPMRSIPFFHQLIDCSFGFFGLVPILIVRKKIRELEMIN